MRVLLLFLLLLVKKFLLFQFLFLLVLYIVNLTIVLGECFGLGLILVLLLSEDSSELFLTVWDVALFCWLFVKLEWGEMGRKLF